MRTIEINLLDSVKEPDCLEIEVFKAFQIHASKVKPIQKLNRHLHGCHSEKSLGVLLRETSKESAKVI